MAGSQKFAQQKNHPKIDRTNQLEFHYDSRSHKKALATHANNSKNYSSSLIGSFKPKHTMAVNRMTNMAVGAAYM